LGFPLFNRRTRSLQRSQRGTMRMRGLTGLLVDPQNEKMARSLRFTYFHACAIHLSLNHVYSQLVAVFHGIAIQVSEIVRTHTLKFNKQMTLGRQ
jgi:hypothetical protein